MDYGMEEVSRERNWHEQRSRGEEAQSPFAFLQVIHWCR